MTGLILRKEAAVGCAEIEGKLKRKAVHGADWILDSCPEVPAALSFACRRLGARLV